MNRIIGKEERNFPKDKEIIGFFKNMYH